MGTGRWMVAAGALLMSSGGARAEPPATPAPSRVSPAIAALPPGGFLMSSVVDNAGVITGMRWTFHVDDVAIGSVDASEAQTLIAPVR
jgi:hypothetical protein